MNEVSNKTCIPNNVYDVITLPGFNVGSSQNNKNMDVCSTEPKYTTGLSYVVLNNMCLIKLIICKVMVTGK